MGWSIKRKTDVNKGEENNNMSKLRKMVAGVADLFAEVIKTDRDHSWTT